MLPDAEQELLLSVQIDPNQADARNTLGTIYAEEGKFSRAQETWNELVDADPNYAPAQQNLKILQQVESGQLKSSETISSGLVHAP